ncbi:hypothetical protein ACFQVC_14000 [Streptomyces monticola]|uniref:Sortase n=1 Tax=Streptomyces monticola TaxID=2666263 RepID=A0ABW2JIK6_9ACTN
MRRLALTLCATALLATAPTAAFAGDPAGVKITPSQAAPGAEVQIAATGCDGTTGAAKSEAFVADGSLTGRDGKGFPLSGEAMIRSTVTPGTYDVSVTCDGEDGKAKGTVTVARSQPSPTAPIRAGGGGTAQLAAQAEDGPGKRHVLIGGLLATAAGLAVAGRLIRRRRRPE